MGQNARFIIVNGDEHFGDGLRAILLNLKGAKIVAEIEEPAMLAQATEQFPADVLLVNLDPSPEAILPIVGDVAASHRELAVFVTSESTDGQLVIKAMRMGIREFLPKPIDESSLVEAVDRVAVARLETSAQGKLITVVGTSGGVGATMIATNLAVELAALATGDVTVVDLDYRFGQVATFLDVDPRYTLSDLCGSPEALDPQVIGRALAQHASGVRVLCRPNHLAEADTITAAACMGVFSNLIQLNEYVVADGPGRFDVSGKSVLALADITLLVVQPLVPCVRNAQRIIDSMRETGYNLDRAKLICNRTGRGKGYLSVSDVTETLGLENYASLPDEWETASGAINLGEPLLSFGPKSKLRLTLQEIAERLHAPDSGTDDKDARAHGLLDRLFAGS
jgi:pilus assembly protein CpaE